MNKSIYSTQWERPSPTISKFLTNRFCIILGQRDIGKTTAMVRHLLDLAGNDRFSETILYVRADHFLIQSRSLYGIADAISQSRRKNHLL